MNSKDRKNSLNFLHSAVNLKRKEIISLLLEHGADPNCRDYQKRTPLFYADDLEIVADLLMYGAHLDCIDEEGTSYFMSALELSKSTIIERLLSWGVDLYKIDGNKCNALHKAINLADAKICKTIVNWPLKLAESKELVSGIQFLRSINSDVDKIVIYILWILRRVGEIIKLKIPKGVCLMIIAECIRPYSDKLWQSPYAQEILTSDKPGEIALAYIQKLMTQKNKTNITPWDLLSVKLLQSEKDVNIFIPIEGDEETQDIIDRTKERYENFLAIENILEPYVKKEENN